MQTAGETTLIKKNPPSVDDKKKGKDDRTTAAFLSSYARPTLINPPGKKKEKTAGIFLYFLFPFLSSLFKLSSWSVDEESKR